MNRYSLTIIMIFIILGCNVSDHRGEKLTKEQIIEKATEFAISEEEYPMKGVEILYDPDNTKWKEHFKQVLLEQPRFSSLNNYVHKELEGKEYKAVCFTNPKEKLAGSLWVFIDIYTGSVILFAPNM